jgi:hypothetical protein
MATQANANPASLLMVTVSCKMIIPKRAGITHDRPIMGATTEAGPLEKALNIRMNPTPITIPATHAYTENLDMLRGILYVIINAAIIRLATIHLSRAMLSADMRPVANFEMDSSNPNITMPSRASSK